MKVRDDIFKSHRRGYQDAIGYRKDDPTLKDLQPIAESELIEGLKKSGSGVVNRYTGRTDTAETDKNFREAVLKYAYRSGVLRAQRKTYMTPEKIFQVAKKVYLGE